MLRSQEEIEDKLEELMDPPKRSFGFLEGFQSPKRAGKIEALRWALHEKKELLIDD